jgi:hypothetical protein
MHLSESYCIANPLSFRGLDLIPELSKRLLGMFKNSYGLLGGLLANCSEDLGSEDSDGLLCDLLDGILVCSPEE